MQKSRIRLGLTALACGMFFGASARATIVVPAAQQSTLGNGQGTTLLGNYGTTGNRYQQVYTSAVLGGFSSNEAITGLAFRAKQAAFLSFIGNTVNVSNVIITLSTTQKNDADTLDPTFANNIGPDVTTVYSGPLTLTSALGGTTAIDYNITLQHAFNYNKSLGNLLLDITVPDGATVSGNGSIGYEAMDTYTDAFPSADGIGSATGATGSATIGSNSTTGYVTEFVSSPAPEPTSLGVLAGGAMILRDDVGKN